ncbi:uncharacterized protein DUF1176 [Enterobacter sp. BIGb0383]|uniref:DUF1176 domain-containing protein n=1 Tax=unclassified Enterobacter TaxID=2608935 RepID=UPI000F461AC5|nr:MULTISPECIES: DUF1176 domain-containing protein [unclassified Enterobacter]ROP63046.1 uncharacterized protein DUF1176 [Enterobacter sp. BIGb0383]ROS13207.1 uncharacterized protein DUF1176 [Enterobacter sp. BIGb0359]
MGFRTLLLLLAILPASLTWAAPAQQRFTDWQVTCNNQNFCVARNVGAHDGLVMTLSRSAGARTDAVLRIDYGGLDRSVTHAPPLAPALLLDEQPLVPDPKSWRITPLHLLTDNSTTIDAFLNEIREGQSITLRDARPAISLQGLKAALLFIDTQQKRVGSETAWIRKGSQPPLSVPPAPALKEVVQSGPAPAPLTREERNDLLDYGTWRINTNQCSLDPQRREVSVGGLSDDKALLMVSCEAGAYNTINLAWIVSRQKPFAARSVQLHLPFQPQDASRDLELINATFDEQTRELVTLAKGRGLGDCGVQTRWRFDGQRFRLVRYAGQSVCDGWQGADAWPTQWITR